MIGAIIKEFIARTGVNVLVIKLLDNIDDSSVGWGLQCTLLVSAWSARLIGVHGQ